MDKQMKEQMAEEIAFEKKLGNALYKFYDGQTLEPEDLKMIASSSDHDKLQALETNALIRLGLRTDNSHYNFCSNTKTISIIKQSSSNNKHM